MSRDFFVCLFAEREGVEKSPLVLVPPANFSRITRLRPAAWGSGLPDFSDPRTMMREVRTAVLHTVGDAGFRSPQAGNWV